MQKKRQHIKPDSLNPWRNFSCRRPFSTGYNPSSNCEWQRTGARLDGEKINSYVAVYKFMMRILCVQHVNKSYVIYPFSEMIAAFEILAFTTSFIFRISFLSFYCSHQFFKFNFTRFRVGELSSWQDWCWFLPEALPKNFSPCSTRWNFNFWFSKLTSSSIQSNLIPLKFQHSLVFVLSAHKMILSIYIFRRSEQFASSSGIQ